MVTRKKKTPKTDPKKLLEIAVDKSLLNNRKINKNLDNTSHILKEDENKIITKWNNIQKSDFIKKEINGKFYAKHIEWKKRVWIGPYDTEKELDSVINSYVKETKKEPIYRNIKNIRSTLIDE